MLPHARLAQRVAARQSARYVIVRLAGWRVRRQAYRQDSYWRQGFASVAFHLRRYGCHQPSSLTPRHTPRLPAVLPPVLRLLLPPVACHGIESSASSPLRLPSYLRHGAYAKPSLLLLLTTAMKRYVPPMTIIPCRRRLRWRLDSSSSTTPLRIIRPQMSPHRRPDGRRFVDERHLQPPASARRRSSLATYKRRPTARRKMPPLPPLVCATVKCATAARPPFSLPLPSTSSPSFFHTTASFVCQLSPAI